LSYSNLFSRSQNGDSSFFKADKIFGCPLSQKVSKNKSFGPISLPKISNILCKLYLKFAVSLQFDDYATKQMKFIVLRFQVK